MVAAMLEMRECPPSFSSCTRLSEEERKQVFLAASCEGRIIPAQAARELVTSYWSPTNSEVGPVTLYGVYVPREDPWPEAGARCRHPHGEQQIGKRGHPGA
ncbi:MAG: hypothetical protein U0446_00775 [Dehalococcoidia bacterium]